MMMIVVFFRHLALATWMVSIGWLYLQNPAAVAIGSFVQFLQNPSTAILSVSVALVLVVLEWLS